MHRTEILTRKHSSARRAFRSGVDALDNYLQRIASQDLRKHATVPYVLVDDDSGAIQGFYTLSAASVDLDELPPVAASGLARYTTVSATLIGRLAVDERYQGQRIGVYLLSEALRRCLEASQFVASSLVVVDSKDATARRFYTHFNFMPLSGRPSRLCLPMKMVRALFT